MSEEPPAIDPCAVQDSLTSLISLAGSAGAINADAAQAAAGLLSASLSAGGCAAAPAAPAPITAEPDDGDSTAAADDEEEEVEDTLIEGAADDVFDEETQAALSTNPGLPVAEALGSAVLVSLASGAAAAAAAAGGNATGNETTVNVVSLATPEVNMTIVLAASPAAFANQSFACDTPSGEAASVQLPEAALESALAGLAAKSEGDDGESYGVGMVVYTRAAPPPLEGPVVSFSLHGGKNFEEIKVAGVDPPIRMTLPITSSAATCEDLPLDGIEINGQSKMWVSSDGTSCAEYKEFNFCANYSFDEYYRNTYVGGEACCTCGGGQKGEVEVSCQFWNQTKGAWSTEGCQIVQVEGARGHLGEVECECSHLTDFMAFEIPMTAEELLEDVQQGAAINTFTGEQFLECVKPTWERSPFVYIVIGAVTLSCFLCLTWAVYRDRKETLFVLALVDEKMRERQRAKARAKARVRGRSSMGRRSSVSAFSGRRSTVSGDRRSTTSGGDRWRATGRRSSLFGRMMSSGIARDMGDELASTRRRSSVSNEEDPIAALAAQALAAQRLRRSVVAPEASSTARARAQREEVMRVLERPPSPPPTPPPQLEVDGWRHLELARRSTRAGRAPGLGSVAPPASNSRTGCELK